MVLLYSQTLFHATLSVMETQIQFESPEKEIEYLEGKILEKKRELAEKSSHETVSEVLHEHARVAPASPQSDVQNTPSHAAAQDLDKDVGYLVQVAFSDGVFEAVRRVRETHNPHLIDAFHDALVDRFVHDLTAKGLLPHE